MSGPWLHSAPWLVPVDGPILADAGLLVEHGRIVAAGPREELRRRFPLTRESRYPGAALTPPLVNAHIHLELSHLAELAYSQPRSFTQWIVNLLALRDRLGAKGEAACQAARQTALTQHQGGVSLLADIGNTTIGREIDNFPGKLMAFKEYLGLHSAGLDKQLRRLDSEPGTALCSGHALYSTHPQLLQAVKARAAKLGQIFPIHTAEPAAEGEMLQAGKGEMADFIRKRGFWDENFILRPGKGPVRVLYDLGLLDEKTLCVHAVHVSDEEIRILAGEGTKVCLCPGSNRFLGAGRPPVRRYLEQGLLPALGTDSAASNPDMSLWQEMRILAEEHPEVSLEVIFSMATKGGAEALDMGKRLGSLAPGKDADFLAVELPEARNAGEVYAALVRGPRPMVRHILLS